MNSILLSSFNTTSCIHLYHCHPLISLKNQYGHMKTGIFCINTLWWTVNIGSCFTRGLIWHFSTIRPSICFKFDCEITLKSIPGTNQYLAISVVSCSRKQWGPLLGFEPTTNTLRRYCMWLHVYKQWTLPLPTTSVPPFCMPSPFKLPPRFSFFACKHILQRFRSAVITK